MVSLYESAWGNTVHNAQNIKCRENIFDSRILPGCMRCHLSGVMQQLEDDQDDIDVVL